MLQLSQLQRSYDEAIADRQQAEHALRDRDVTISRLKAASPAGRTRRRSVKEAVAILERGSKSPTSPRSPRSAGFTVANCVEMWTQTMPGAMIDAETHTARISEQIDARHAAEVSTNVVIHQKQLN